MDFAVHYAPIYPNQLGAIQTYTQLRILKRDDWRNPDCVLFLPLVHLLPVLQRVLGGNRANSLRRE